MSEMSTTEGLAQSVSVGVVTNSFPAVTEKMTTMVSQNNGNFKDTAEKKQIQNSFNGVKIPNNNIDSLDDKPPPNSGNVNGDGHEEEEEKEKEKEEDVVSSLSMKNNLANIDKDTESPMEGSQTGDSSIHGSPSVSLEKNNSNSCDVNTNNNVESNDKISVDKENSDSVMPKGGGDSSQHSQCSSVKNESLSNSKPFKDDKLESDKIPISLGNKVRNSFKDIMSKIAQDKDSGLGKILLKQKAKESESSGDSSELDTSEHRNVCDKISVVDIKKNENSNSSLSNTGTPDRATPLKSDSEMEGVLSEVSKKIALFPSGSSDEDSNRSKMPNGFSEFSDNATDNDLACRDSDTKTEPTDKIKEDISFSSFLKHENSEKVEETSRGSNVSDGVKNECVDEEMPQKSEIKEETSMDIDSVEPEEDLESSKPEAVIKSTENSRDSLGRASIGSDRKRPVDDSSDSCQSSKRSRLDNVIGKLGSQLGVEPDGVEEKESTPVESENDNVSRAASESDNEQDDRIDTASSVLEESDDEKSNSMSTKERLLRVTEKEISRIVQRKLRTYLKKQKDSILAQMSVKVTELHTQCEQWKQQAKRLQTEVKNLTVLNQRLEKRKAATAALRQINTRSFGVQVDETKADMMAQMQLSHNKSPGKLLKNYAASSTAKTVINSPQVQNPQIITQLNSKVLANKANPSSISVTTSSNILTQALPNMTPATNVPSTSNSSLIRTIIAEPPGVSKVLSTGPTQAPQTSVTSPPQLVKFPVTNTVRNLIEMTKHTITKDSINSSKTATSTSTQNVLIVSSTCAATTNVVQRPIMNASAPPTNPVTQVVGKHSTVKIIDLTADDDKMGGLQGRALQNIPNSNLSQPGGLQLPQGSYIISTPQASPIVTPGQGVRPPGGLFQMVLTSNPSTPIKPGSLLTVVPARNLAPPLPVQTTGVRPSTVVSTIVTPPVVTQVPQQIRPGQQLQLSGKPVVVRPPVSTVISTPSQAQSYTGQPTLPRQPPPPYSTALQSVKSSQIVKPPQEGSLLQHPAPLPSTPTVVAHSSKLLPPKPSLKISRVSQGIVLSWNMTVTEAHSEISTYQLYAYQEGAAPPTSSLWKKVGDVKALPLPMACTLTQFQEGNKYHFAVRALDQHGRMGPFSDPSTIHLLPQKS